MLAWRSATASRPRLSCFTSCDAALDILQDHDPARITTLGGECSVSMAPFSYLMELERRRRASSAAATQENAASAMEPDLPSSST